MVVEFVKDGKWARPEEGGELICTGLHSYTMPFIRYRIGDIGILGGKQCSCGRGLPLMKKLEGRSEDLIKLPNDKIFTGPALFSIMGDMRGIQQYRVVQKEIDKITICLVKRKDFDPSIPRQIRERVKKALGKDIRVKIDIVDGIPKDSCGKRRSVISKV